MSKEIKKQVIKRVSICRHEYILITLINTVK